MDDKDGWKKLLGPQHLGRVTVSNIANTVTVHTEKRTQIEHSTLPLQLSNISATFLQAFLITAACVSSDKAADIPCRAGGKWCIQQRVIITWQSDNL